MKQSDTPKSTASKAEEKGFRHALFQSHLNTKALGRSLLLFRSLDSTNTEGKRQLLDDAAHGTVILAEGQTAGRGRLGRSFYSPEGSGIYLTVCLRPGITAEELPLLTPAAGVAAARAIEEVCGISVGIKWVNDIMKDGKKLAGILSESVVDPREDAPLAVVGIGINVNSTAFPKELRDIAGSLDEFTDTPPSREEIAAAFFNQLEPLIEDFSPKAFLPAYRQYSTLIGKSVTVKAEPPKKAHVTGIGDRCELLLEDENGTPFSLSTGEVSVREV